MKMIFRNNTIQISEDVLPHRLKLIFKKWSYILRSLFTDRMRMAILLKLYKNRTKNYANFMWLKFKNGGMILAINQNIVVCAVPYTK
jgi:hypothetical protein